MEQNSQIHTYLVIDIYKAKIFFSTGAILLQCAMIENRDRAVLHSSVHLWYSPGEYHRQKPPSHWFSMVTWFVSGIHQVNTTDELVFTWWIPFNTEYQFY